ncbi:hypothetical protein H8E07_22660 [bacterium]|nr:hypothetical protein [bacterium]
MSSEPGLAWIQTCSVALLLTGLVSRIAPLFDHGGRLMRQFPTEDGFLMMTVARNLALGHGLTSSAGAIPTNGVQPLFTFVQSLVFLVVIGDKRDGVLLVMVLHIVLALLGAWLIHRLAGRLLAGHTHRSSISLLAATLWFACPVVVNNSMNGLESGLYVVCLLTVLSVWLADRPHIFRTQVSLGLLWVGVLLGVAFWARNDAVFLVVVMTAWHVLYGLRGRREDLAVRIKEALLMGAGALGVAAPWLIFNQTRFGSIVPISALSQTAETAFGANLVNVPSKLFEYISIVLPVPTALETHGAVVAVTSVITIVFFVSAVAMARRLGGATGLFIHVVLSFALLMTVYYGLFHGAPWFISRYFFPLSPFMAILSVTYLLSGITHLVARRQRAWSRVIATVLVVLALALNVRVYVEGPENQYLQLVAWIEANVADGQWVGAPQSGTIGYFHDLTVNLDGKLNPEALQAKQADRFPDYIVNGTFGASQDRIAYIVDWKHIAKWRRIPLIDSNFELIEKDAHANLAVWRRR